MSENRSTPRVAESLDDLAVGMVVVQRVNGEWLNPFTLTEDDIYGQIWWTKQFEKSPLVILQDADPPAPPAPDWLVPADTMEALRASVRDKAHGTYIITLIDAVNAVLDAATEVER